MGAKEHFMGQLELNDLYGLKINTGKIKAMIVDQRHNNPFN